MAPAKKAAAKKATAKKATAKKATKKATAKKATAKKATKKATAKKGTAKKAAKKGTKKATKRNPSSASSGGNVVVASKVREAVRGQDVRMSSEFVDALNDHVNEIITKAADRAKGNKRGTVRPGDL